VRRRIPGVGSALQIQGDSTTGRIGGPGLHQRHLSCGFASETLADLLEFLGEEVDVVMSSTGEITKGLRTN
jgi:hypothetical protein